MLDCPYYQHFHNASPPIFTLHHCLRIEWLALIEKLDSYILARWMRDDNNTIGKLGDVYFCNSSYLAKLCLAGAVCTKMPQLCSQVIGQFRGLHLR